MDRGRYWDVLRIFFLCAIALQAQDLTIRNVTVVDANGSRPRMTVTISSGRIASVSPAHKGERGLDGSGKFLIPGLWDMHVHLWESDPMLGLYVANGVLGIRDMGSDPARTKAWRREAAAGKRIGPRIYTPGPPVDGPETPAGKMPLLRAGTPDEGRNAADQIDGPMMLDFIKVMSSLSKDAYLSLAHRARVRRAVFAGHVPESVTVDEAINERQKSMEHLFGMALACSLEERELRTERARAIAEKDYAALRKVRERTYATYSEAKAMRLFERMVRFGVWQTPTLILRKRLALLDVEDLVKDRRTKYVPEEIRKTWEDPRADLKQASEETRRNLQQDYDQHVAIVAAMRRAGVGLLAGTDTGDAYVLPGFALHDELALLVEAGLTPLEALQSATLNPARYFNVEAATGTVQAGKVADLVLLDADPLADIRNTGKIRAVVQHGVLLDRKRLDAVLDGKDTGPGIPQISLTPPAPVKPRTGRRAVSRRKVK